MTELPIIFSAPMVKAILDGRKTQTRRVLKPQIVCHTGPVPSFTWGKFSGLYPDDWFGYGNEIDGALPYAVGDRLWVREAWRTEAQFDPLPPRDVPEGAIASYETDYSGEPNDGCRGRYRHARFMPRWASRITLEVTKVRVQRLQEISEEDARAEGAYIGKASGRVADSYAAMALGGEWFGTARLWYADLWSRLHGPDAWKANPWVAAISFRRVE